METGVNGVNGANVVRRASKDSNHDHVIVIHLLLNMVVSHAVTRPRNLAFATSMCLAQVSLWQFGVGLSEFLFNKWAFSSVLNVHSPFIDDRGNPSLFLRHFYSNNRHKSDNYNHCHHVFNMAIIKRGWNWKERMKSSLAIMTLFSCHHCHHHHYHHYHRHRFVIEIIDTCRLDFRMETWTCSIWLLRSLKTKIN